MSEKKRKNFSSQFKAKVALEAIRGVKTVTEIAQAFGVHPTQVGQWKKDLQEQASAIFDSKRDPAPADPAASSERLYSEIGRLGEPWGENLGDVVTYVAKLLTSPSKIGNVVSRRACLDATGALHHIMVRGIDKAKYPWMDTATVLARFGGTKRKAGNAYRRFMQEGMDQGHDPQFSGGGLVRSLGGWSNVLSMRRKGHKEEVDERILGSGEFVHQVIKEAEQKSLRQMKLKRLGLTLIKIIEQECKKSGVSRKELESGGRRSKVSQTRAEIAQRGMIELGLPAAEIARHLGVATSSITRSVEKNGK